MSAVYRLLLRLFPRPFRDRYETDLLRSYEDARRAAGSRGPGALAAFHLASLRDLVVNALAERAAAPGVLPAAPPRWGAYSRATSVGQDVRFALRMMWRRPALSLFSIGTLGLGIGAATAVASLAHAVLLAPLPFPDSRPVVAVRGLLNGRSAGMSLENVVDMSQRSRTLAALTPFFAQSVNLTGVPEPDRLRGAFVTSDFFQVVATMPRSGRPLSIASDTVGGPREAVVTDAAWRVRFGARPDLIGQAVILNNTPYTIVGIMPGGFRIPVDEPEVFLPWWTSPSGGGRGNHNFFGIGRLAPGASVADAGAEAASIAAALEQEFPTINRGRSAQVHRLKQVLSEDAAPPVALLVTMVVILLLGACANVAALQLSATAARHQEMAIRAALGAGRPRIVRQLLVESLVRAGAGAILGVLGAHAAVRVLVANAPGDVHGLADAAIRPGIVAVAALLAFVAGVLAGLPLTLHATRGTAAWSAFGRLVGRPSLTRVWLVTGQVAIAAILLVVAGLTTRSFVRIATTDPGFDAAHLLTLEYRLPRNKYDSVESQRAFHQQVLDRIRSLPGVMDAAAVRALPFSGNGSTAALDGGDGALQDVRVNAVSDRYFETMRIATVSGRTFDHRDAAPVAVVSRALAARLWPGADPLGRAVRFPAIDRAATVVGVVADVRHRDLTDAGGSVYISQAQDPGVFNTVVVRTAGAPMSLAESVRRAIREVDPDQPVWKVRSMEGLVAQSLVSRRFLLQIVAFFGLAAAGLSIVGLYATVATDVAQRRRELGLRIALGATRTGVLRLVLAGGVRLTAVGLGCGLAGALALSRLLDRFLFGIDGRDPLTYAAVAAALFLAAMLATWLPARSAARVDPILPLREA